MGPKSFTRCIEISKNLKFLQDIFSYIQPLDELNINILKHFWSLMLKMRLSIGFDSNVPKKLDHWANRGNLCSIETVQNSAKKELRNHFVRFDLQ